MHVKPIAYVFCCMLVSSGSVWDENTSSALYYRLRDGGFNNQLVTVFIGIATAHALNMTYVLPHMLEDGQYGHKHRRHYPFGDYFDVELLGRLVPTVDGGVFAVRCGRRLAACVLDPPLPQTVHPTHVEVGLGFQDPLAEGLEILNASTFLQLPPLSHKCVSFLTLHTEVGYDGLGPYSEFESGHQYQGFDPKNNSLFASIRRHLLPSEPLREEAAKFLALHNLLTGPFLGLHVRRGDYKTDRCGPKRKGAHKALGAPSPQHVCPTDAHIISCIRNMFNVTTGGPSHDATVLVATNLEDIGHVFNLLRTSLPGFRVLRYAPLRNSAIASRVDLQAVVEQYLLLQAHTFVGNMVSSWSSTIFSGRDVFRKVPGNVVWGDCEQPQFTGTIPYHFFTRDSFE